MELVIKMSVEEAQLVLNALGELPYKASATVIASIKLQAEDQLKQASINAGKPTTEVVESDAQ